MPSFSLRLRRPLIRVPFCIPVAILVIAGVSACSRTPPPGAAQGQAPVKPVYGETGRLERLEQDANRDGRIDTWAYMDGARAVRAEIDEDGDGRIDRWEYYVPAPGQAGPLVVLDRIEKATRHDGRVSRWEYYENGQFARVEEDTSGDGRVDKWEIYKDGALQTMLLDSAGRGRADRRLTYQGGDVVRVEEDPDGTGTFRPVKGAR